MADTDSPDILVALRALIASLPDSDTVPRLLEMQPATFHRLEALGRRGAPWSSPFDPFLPIKFDYDIDSFAVRVTYASGRQEVLSLAPASPATPAPPIDRPPADGYNPL